MDSFVNKVQRAGSRLKADGFGELSNDCFDAADYIERLEAVVRAGDEMEAARLRIGQTERDTRERRSAVRVLNAAETKYDAARSRVNLSSQADADGKEGSNGNA